MEIEHRSFEYKGEDGSIFEGLLALPKSRSGPLPGVLIFHAFGGCGHFEMERAKELAKLGYAALAADVYGKGKRGKNVDENRALMSPLKEDRPGKLKHNLVAAYNALKGEEEVNGERIGAIGYCFGGLCALDLARHRVGAKVAISFHGTFDPLPGTTNEPIETTIQIHHGDADFHIKKESIDGIHQEMRERDADWSFCTYGKAAHGFTEPESDKWQRPGVGYNRDADIRSWAAATALLREKLQ